MGAEPRSFVAAMLAVWVGALVLGGCGLAVERRAAGGPSTDPPVTPATTTSAAPSGAEIAEARAGLPRLRVVERRPSGLPPYDRDAFGEAWDDTDGNGCNQRDDVLLRDVLPGTVVVQEQGACDHDVLAGSWLDPYTATLLTFDDLKDPSQAQAIQIDHVVPLAEAWISGASSWSAERRRSYANDLAGLLAVDGPSNASKGAEDPAAWRPRKGFQCAYAVRWIRTKSAWDLAVDVSEVRALEDMLTRCS